MERELPAAPTLTHPDRVLYPDDGVTKRMLADYLSAVASRLLPHLAGRPLGILRAVGRQRPFFQKHHTGVARAGLARVVIDSGSGPRDYLICRDASGLASLAQLGAVELHTWGSAQPDPLCANRLTFDLDPDPTLDWRKVADGALAVRTLLAELGLRSFCKTTGGQGLHVVAPLTGMLPDWSAARDFARSLAQHLARGFPDRYTATSGARNRRGRIYIDYLRNCVGASAIAAWSPRLRPGVPVSMPLAWREVAADEDLRGTRFTLPALARAGTPRGRDPWAAYARVDQPFDPGALRRLTARSRRAPATQRPRLPPPAGARQGARSGE